MNYLPVRQNIDWKMHYLAIDELSGRALASCHWGFQSSEPQKPVTESLLGILWCHLSNYPLTKIKTLTPQKLLVHIVFPRINIHAKIRSCNRIYFSCALVKY